MLRLLLLRSIDFSCNFPPFSIIPKYPFPTNDIINAQICLNKKSALDKNGLLYKYNLYTLYKLQGSEEIAPETLREIKTATLKTPQDYIDMSEIYYDLSELDNSIKILNKGAKRFPDEKSLTHQKNKILSRVK